MLVVFVIGVSIGASEPNRKYIYVHTYNTWKSERFS